MGHPLATPHETEIEFLYKENHFIAKFLAMDEIAFNMILLFAWGK
jgi:hypothetical protein